MRHPASRRQRTQSSQKGATEMWDMEGLQRWGGSGRSPGLASASGARTTEQVGTSATVDCGGEHAHCDRGARQASRPPSCRPNAELFFLNLSIGAWLQPFCHVFLVLLARVLRAFFFGGGVGAMGGTSAPCASSRCRAWHGRFLLEFTEQWTVPPPPAHLDGW